MSMNLRARAKGIIVGELPTGPLNKISDVPGVTVGHVTITEGKHNTGVTVVMPCEDNMFTSKLTAAEYVLNGFGKTAGLMQIDELGNIETPIALTNTLNVGLVHDALVGYMIDRCEKENVRLRSVNPVVCECNDASLNDIRHRAVKEEHVLKAIQSVCKDFEEGAVGAGRGMTCHGLKGGIGSSSRLVTIGKEYTLGVLALTNHGRMADLTIAGERVGERIQQEIKSELPDKGSCIIIMATDIPMTDRQLKRVVKRAGVGLARLGSFIGHGSGEVFIGFTTANRIPKDANNGELMQMSAIHEDHIDKVFRAMAETTEEAVLNSMLMAETVVSAEGTVRKSLSEFI